MYILKENEELEKKIRDIFGTTVTKVWFCHFAKGGMLSEKTFNELENEVQLEETPYGELKMKKGNILLQLDWGCGILIRSAEAGLSLVHIPPGSMEVIK